MDEHLPLMPMVVEASRLLPRVRLRGVLVVHALVVSITGLLLGFDLCIAGAILTPVQRSLHLCFPCPGGDGDAALVHCTCMEKELAISAVSIGAMVGALGGGVAADLFGRRNALLASDVLFAAGGMGMARAQPDTRWLFFVGRAAVGMALGLGGAASSAYLAEIAPTKWRGRFLQGNELAVCTGCLAAYALAYLFGDGRWRLSIGVTVIVALVQLLMILLCVYESPQWLASRALHQRAARARAVLGGNEYPSSSAPAASDTDSSSSTTDSNTAGRRRPPLSRTCKSVVVALRASQRPLLLAFGVAVAHSATAANTVLYYSREVLQLAGVSKPLLVNASVGVTKFIGVAIAMALTDRIGRRALLLSGTATMAIALVGLSCSFINAAHPTAALAVCSLLGFILGWDLSWAGLMVTVIAEVLPQDVRGVGCGLAYSLYWALSFVSGQFFESAFDAFGVAQTFALICAACVAVLLWTVRYVPETANRSLEHITSQYGVQGNEQDGLTAQATGDRA